MDSAVSGEGGAKSGAPATESAIEALPADLRAIVEAWPDLSAEKRAKILALATIGRG